MVIAVGCRRKWFNLTRLCSAAGLLYLQEATIDCPKATKAARHHRLQIYIPDRETSSARLIVLNLAFQHFSSKNSYVSDSLRLVYDLMAPDTFK